MHKRFLNDKPLTPDENRRIHEMIKEAEERFNKMSEEDQVLHLLAQRLGAVRELAKSKESMLASARRIISDSHGPKFADRVLADPSCLKKLHLDTFTPAAETVTTVVQEG